MAEAGTRCVVAVDQGTSSTKAIAVDDNGVIRGTARRPISVAHPAPGHVEQDMAEILASVHAAIDDVAAALDPSLEVTAVGISSQRESSVVWDRRSCQPLSSMLGWQDRRTTPAADDLRALGAGDDIRQRSGLPIDPMFSALKFGWLLDDVDPDRRRCRAGEIAVGTVDAFLVAALTGDHRIEAGNASRTQLMNLGQVAWDPSLTDLFRVPESALPPIAASDAATTPLSDGRLAGVPITGILGDSHAALYAHGVRAPGAIKATYGTGSSVMGLIDDLASLDEGVVATLAWQTDAPAYAGEGNILATGATIVWLSSVLGIEPEELMALAEANQDPVDVDLVPAVAGLGAPWWDDRASAIITGFDLGTTRSALAAAAADSIVLQIEDVVAVLDRAGVRCDEMLVDGGPADNDWLMQRQADVSQRRVIRRSDVGLSALGAAHLAGVSVGLFDSESVLAAASETTSFEPGADSPEGARSRQDRWHRALDRSRSGGGPGDGP